MLRTILIGERLLAQKIARALAGRKVYVAAFTNVQGTMALLKQDDFNLVLVDGSLDNAESVCALISQQCPVAIALILKGPQANLGNRLSPNIDGVVSEDCLPGELEACLQDIARRHKRQYPKAEILIIEDDPQIQESLILSFKIYWPEAEIHPARSGEEGLDLARQQAPDAVLLDLGLPGISGFETLAELRQFCQAPVIIITANTEEAARNEAMRLGAKEYLTKPFRQAELMSRAIKHIQREISDRSPGQRASNAWSTLIGN
jgi:DNA-binding response OmpR family regulator